MLEMDWAELIRPLELQQSDMMNLPSRLPDSRSYDQHQRLAMGAYAPQLLYANRMQVHVIDPGNGYHIQITGQIPDNETGPVRHNSLR